MRIAPVQVCVGTHGEDVAGGAHPPGGAKRLDLAARARAARGPSPDYADFSGVDLESDNCKSRIPHYYIVLFSDRDCNIFLF